MLLGAGVLCSECSPTVIPSAFPRRHSEERTTRNLGCSSEGVLCSENVACRRDFRFLTTFGMTAEADRGGFGGVGGTVGERGGVRGLAPRLGNCYSDDIRQIDTARSSGL